MTKRTILNYLLSLSLLVVSTNASAAAKPTKKKPAPKQVGSIVTEAQILRQTVGRKKIICLNKTPGSIKQTTKGLLFTSYAQQLKKASAKKAAGLRGLIAIGKKACKVSPDYLSLLPYKGTFGWDEAAHLYGRATFGGSPQDVAAAVQRGLDGAVNTLLTPVTVPGRDDQVKSIECNGKLLGYFGETDDVDDCDPTDKNDIYPPGVRYAREFRIKEDPNTFQNRLWFFIHDERMATNMNVLDGCEYWALDEYDKILDAVATTGDYHQYLTSVSTSMLLAMVYLDLRSSTGDKPNQNYAREILELGSVGASNIAGVPNYNDEDITNVALALAGWSEKYVEEGPGGHPICLVGYFPGLSATFQKTVFVGTPYEAKIYNSTDLIRAIFANPAIAENLATDIWREFINPQVNKVGIDALKAKIIAADYNLISVFHDVFRSRAFYAAQNRRTILKHPMDLLFGFMRQTGIPVHFQSVDNYLMDMGEVPFLAPSVFGWYQRKLQDEAHVPIWDSTAIELVQHDTNDWKTDNGYDFYNQFLVDKPTSDELVQRLSKFLNIPMNAAQAAIADRYLNFNLTQCDEDSASECLLPGQKFYWKRDAFDSFPDGNWDGKTKGLLAALAMSQPYRMK